MVCNGDSVANAAGQFDQHSASRVSAGEINFRNGGAPPRDAVYGAVRQWPATVLAINMGGGAHSNLTVYLALKNRVLMKAAPAMAVVALVTHYLAIPVRRVGVTLPKESANPSPATRRGDGSEHRRDRRINPAMEPWQRVDRDAPGRKNLLRIRQPWWDEITSPVS